jgi:ABC-type nickel/cobalt efflux system permease component RcnA
MALFIATVIASLTRLMLGFTGAEPIEGAIGTALVFVAVGATLVHYVRACMRRHCRHNPGNGDHHHRHGTSGVDKAAGGQV